MQRAAIDLTPQFQRVKAERLVKSLGYRLDGADVFGRKIFVNDLTNDRVKLCFDKAGRGGTWSFRTYTGG